MATSEAVAGRRSRSAWSVVDQGLSSLSNMAVSVAVARQVGVRELGGFSVAYVVYTLLVGLTRALTSEPLTVRFSARDGASVRAATAAATGSAAAVALAAALPLVVAGWWAPADVGGPLVALAVFLPGLLVQDVWRFAFVTAGRPRSAAGNDLVWLAVQLPLFAVLPRVMHPSGAAYLGAWGLAATGAAAAAAVQGRAAPALRGAGPWLRAHARPIRAFSFEFVARAGARQLTLSVVGVTTGLAALGALRGGQVVFGPLNVLLLGVSMAAVPEAVRSLGAGAPAMVAFCDRLVAAMAMAAAAYSGAAVLLPAPAGRALLGDSWSGAHDLFVAQGALLASIAACSGYLVGLRAREDLRSSVVTRASLIPATVAGGVAGALAAGAGGLLYGLTAANLVGAVFFRRGLARGVPASRSATTQPAEAWAGPTPPPPSPGQ